VRPAYIDARDEAHVPAHEVHRVLGQFAVFPHIRPSSQAMVWTAPESRSRTRRLTSALQASSALSSTSVSRLSI